MELEDSWTLWAHLPHDIDWAITSYKEIYTFSSLDEAIVCFDMLPAGLIENCMLFLMRKGIQPIWEDPKNRNGGCFSFKVSASDVCAAWKALSFVLIGETISIVDARFTQSCTGISISPKKNFCILKIWLTNCNYSDTKAITPELNDYLILDGCFLKKHCIEK